MYKRSFRSPSSVLLNKRRSLLRKRASLPALPQAMSSEDFRLRRFGSLGALPHRRKADKAGLPAPELASRVFRWRGLCVHFPRERCSIEAAPCVFQYPLRKLLCLTHLTQAISNNHVDVASLCKTFGKQNTVTPNGQGVARNSCGAFDRFLSRV